MVEKDFRRYRRFKWFFNPVFSMFSGLFMQSETYTNRMQAICSKPRPKTLGSLKFDVDLEYGNSTGIRELMPEGFNLCAVSTHRGEETFIITVFQELLSEFPQLRLSLVPRHPQRRKEIIRILERQRLSYTLRTENIQCTTPVFIVDTLGEMPGFMRNAKSSSLGEVFQGESAGIIS